MKTILFALFMITAVTLTIWFLVIPAEVLFGSYKALRHGEWHGWRRNEPH